MGEGGGTGDGQRRVETLYCPMCRPAQDGLSKVMYIAVIYTVCCVISVH